MKKLIAFALIAGIFTGCTTLTLNEYSDPSYQGQFTSVSLAWVESPNLKTKITKTVYGGGLAILTDYDKESAKTGIPRVLLVLRDGVKGSLAKMLQTRGITVTSFADRGSGQALLSVVPLYGITECGHLDCKHSVFVSVSLADAATKKNVWSGTFKVGAPGPTAHQTEEVANDFYGLVVDKLLSEKILK